MVEGPTDRRSWYGQARLHVVLVVHLLRWVLLGGASGILAGFASYAFLRSVSWATDTRLDHGWLLYLLPLAGLVVGLAYHYVGGRSALGANLILDEIHEPQAWVPRRMAPLVFAGSVVTHVFGGSAGREGTAVQMSGSLSDLLARALRLSPADRRLLLVAAIAGGFGSVFGVALAGCLFALEVQAVGRVRYDAIVPAMTASLVGDRVVQALGYHHERMPILAGPDLSIPLVAKVLVVGLACGLVALAFAELTHAVHRAFAAYISWPPLRPVVGGVIVLLMTAVVGNRDYLGLSVPLITKSLAGGVGVAGIAFALKLVFTSVTLGSGFPGGEVTPLFVIGAALGASLAHPLGLPVTLSAAVGFVAVFAGATNTPLACTILGVEMFGAGPIVLLAVACIASYVISGESGIYTSQRRGTIEG
jgi:H+/Cl- antiporter ClcA